ncbi:MAG: hypothetical protein ABJN14_06530 [Paracoccaceae bacterium]
MKMLIYGLVISFGLLANDAQAQGEPTLTIDGKEYPVSVLMNNCQNISDQPEAQIACFNAISQLLEAQNGVQESGETSVPQALEALQNVAQFDNGETGLSITGSNCNIQIVYYNNYFHISRRNVSTIDVFSAEFDVSKLQFDQVVQDQGGQLPFSQGVLDDGEIAAMHGGAALESTEYNFDSKSARTSIGDYAIEVIDQLDVREDQKFQFVLVHPEKSDSSADIWSAFEEFSTVCRQ